MVISHIFVWLFNHPFQNTMSAPFQDRQLKKSLFPLLWQELIDQLEQTPTFKTGDNDLLAFAQQTLAKEGISKRETAQIIQQEIVPLSTKISVLNQLCSYIGYESWADFVNAKQAGDKGNKRSKGPDRDGSSWMLWGP